jgi:hypothetical protein
MELENAHNINNKIYTAPIRKIDCNTIKSFMDALSHESWEEVFQGEDVNRIFNKFLDTYLRTFNASFPVIFKTFKKGSTRPNPWITSGIRTSCKNKRRLYVKYRDSKDHKFKDYYKKYCKVLSQVIRTAKKMHLDLLINQSTNKVKTTWNIIKTLTNNDTNNETINIDKTHYNQNIANDFNLYFASVANTITYKIKKKKLFKYG